MPATYKGKGPARIQMEPAADDTDASYRSVLNQFLQAKQRPNQSPEAFYDYVRRLEKKLEYLPAHFLSGHLYAGLLPGVQEGLAICGITSKSTREEIVKRANTLWEPTSLTATRAAALAAEATEGRPVERSTGRSIPTEEMRQAKRRAKRVEAKRYAQRMGRRNMVLRSNAGEPRGYMSGIAIGPIVYDPGQNQNREEDREVGVSGLADYDDRPAAVTSGYALVGTHTHGVKQEDRDNKFHYAYASPIFGPDSLLARVQCPSCGELGHFARDCPRARPARRPYTQPVRGRGRGRGIVRRRGVSY